EHQRHMIKTVQEIANVVTTESKMVDYFMVRPEKLTIKNKSCYKSTVSAFSDKCFRLGQNEYATGLVYVFANICNQFVPVRSILTAIDKVCY
ncbi:hypothetical protein, partial [Salmonella sp. s55004]|uniref:hypothetical protein n=1 Tax=Salmonella sp. s55004 TaxID=3159675 RepID=UPI0039808362